MELIPDLMTQEDGDHGSGAEFIDETNIYNSGLPITKDMVGSSQSNQVSAPKNLFIAAKAGINGSWFNWFGRWGGAGDLPNFQLVTEVYPRLKLIRMIPNWDNLRNIPLSQRTWNNSTTDPIYSSKKDLTDPNPTSYFDARVMYSRHWKTNKLFAVFSAPGGVIKLNPGEVIASIQCTDGYFIESGNCATNFTVTNTASGIQLALSPTVAIPVDSTNGQVKGVGYIITTSPIPP